MWTLLNEPAQRNVFLQLQATFWIPPRWFVAVKESTDDYKRKRFKWDILMCKILSAFHFPSVTPTAQWLQFNIVLCTTRQMQELVSRRSHRCPDAAERRHVSRQIYQSAAERRSWCEVTVISSTPPPFENNNRNVCLLEWIIRSRQPTALSVPPHRTRRMLMAEMPRRSRHRVFQGIIQFPCWRKGWNVERMLWCTGLMSLREPTRALSYDQPVWRVQKWVALFWVITRMRFLFP